MGLAAFNRMRRLNKERQDKELKEKQANGEYSKLKVDELKTKLTELGVNIPDGAKKDGLIALLEEATKLTE